MARQQLTDWLAENRRMIGVLFTMTVLLMQAGNVVANAAVAKNGP
ncbi:DUF7503 family protein [Haladaptatus sp. NG-SE-30]